MAKQETMKCSAAVAKSADRKLHDVFRPRYAPAQAIYDAFQDEAAKRPGRSVEEWTQAETSAVWKAARDAAQTLGVPVPTMQDVESTESSARGHIDYGAQWAYALARLMEKPRRPMVTAAA